MEQSTSSSQTLQVLTDWNTYTKARCQWGLSSTLLGRLASADWSARQAGPPRITAQQLATAANRLIARTLATMTAAQQQERFNRMFSELTPKGRLGLNPGYPYVSAVQNADGTWTVTIRAEAFSKRKADFAELAPGMVSPSSNSYPGEAILISYSAATWDMGYGSQFVSKVKQVLGDLTGIDMSTQPLLGEKGYLVRRPLNAFLTQERMAQYFLDLGF